VIGDAATAFQVPRATLASMVTERIRDSIVDGTLEPGSQLSEVELANRFGVSRGPVREAIQRLVQEGLLRSEPHRGVFVPVLTDQDVIDVYVARAAVESAALRILVGTHRPGTVETLSRYADEMESAASRDDWEMVGRFDLEFHSALVTLSRSQRLQRMFTTLISETRLCLAALTGAENRHHLVYEHRTICEAVRNGDIEQGLAALDKHYVDAVATLTSTQSDGDGPRGVADR
jgi:DNA-binding GntR family transcriptional regulator